MKNILFVCTGNTCRSPMAQAIFNDICMKKDLDMHASSAGVATVDGLSATQNAVETMSLMGLDISTHKTRFLPNLDLNRYDLFVCMSEDHATLVKNLGIPDSMVTVLYKKSNNKYDLLSGITDPFGMDINGYKKCALDIKEAIEELIKIL